jgi:hypothetical protein
MRKSRFRGKSSRKALSFARFFYPVVGLALLGPALSVWIGLVRLTRTLPFNDAPFYALAAGAATYLLLHIFFRKPMTMYVFGHELTHAVAAVLSGYKVKSLFVSEKGGEVELSDSNVAVALAPYCVPLYTVAVLLVYALVKRYSALSTPPLWVGFCVGLTLVFHLALTVHSLRQDQPDLRHAGTFFSFVMIVLSNGLILVFVLKALYSSVALSNFFEAWWADTRGIFEGLWHGFGWVRAGVVNGGAKN